MLLASIDAVAATTTTAAAVTAAALAAAVSAAAAVNALAAAVLAAAIAAAVAACNGETLVIADAFRQGGSYAIVAVRTDAGQAVAGGRRAR